MRITGFRKLAPLYIVATAFLVGLGGCASSRGNARGCTLIGCSSGVTIDLAALPLQPGLQSKVTLCVDDHCTSRSPNASPLFDAFADIPYHEERAVTVSIIMIGPEGAVLAHSSTTAHLVRVQPNGSDCPPTCYSAHLRLTTTGTLEAT
jgi:hypothetical protein